MTPSTVSSINDNTFQDEVLDAELPVLVDFTAKWCGPCRALAPHLERVAEQFAGRARVVKLDIDENHKTAAMYGVRSIPTLLVFKRGEPVDKLVGNPGSARPLEQLVARNLDERAAAR
ncbi:MAG: thioredoxin [Myxococcales bacterium]|nr:thioredoxin [Myxococcales bacterium]